MQTAKTLFDDIEHQQRDQGNSRRAIEQDFSHFRAYKSPLLS
ncbi:unnamed protein product [Acidithrix sp. C25]|nr:unnamed protein product [Acidithrix sp. C25]